MKTHWKKLHNPDYFGAYCIDEGKDLTVTIDRVTQEDVTGSDGKKETCTVAYLKDHKPLILNVTNAKMIEKVLASPYVEDWSGKRVTLYVTNVKAFGDVVPAVRVRSSAPASENIKRGTAAWTKAVEAVKNKKATIDQVMSKYPDIDIDSFERDVIA